MLVLLVPPLEQVATQIAIVTYCLPLVAIGPILVLVSITRPRSRRSSWPR